MATLSDHFKTIAKEIGLNEDDLKEFFEKLPEDEIPKEISDKFADTYMTLDAAKNNSEIVSHFKDSLKGQYLGFVDNEIEKLLKKVELPNADKVKETKDTQEKLKMIVKSIDSFEKGQDIEWEEEKKKLIDKVNELQGEIDKTKSDYEQKLKEQSQSFDSERVESLITNKLAQKKWADVYEPEDVQMIVRTKLLNGNYVLKRKDDGSIGVFQKDNPELEAHEDNKKLTLDDLIDRESSKFVKKADTPREDEPVQGKPSNRKQSKWVNQGHSQRDPMPKPL